MKASSRILLAVSALLLGLTFFLPLWQISLWAPQYPEGLNLSIWTFKFSGDVQTVNILNHYVGMAPIKAESFPELVYFPKIFAALIAAGLLAAALGKRFGMYLWTGILLCFCVWAMADFHKWETNFSSNLNPDAAIKMEDMVYTPPLFGTKTLLNITVSSYPDWAGYAMTIGVVIACLLSLLEILSWKKLKKITAASVVGLFF